MTKGAMRRKVKREAAKAWAWQLGQYGHGAFTKQSYVRLFCRFWRVQA